MRIFGEFADFESGLWEFLELGYLHKSEFGIGQSWNLPFGPRPKG